MSAKLIIWIPGKPLLNGYKQREFLWSEPHACYLYAGKELDASEFNDVYAKAIKNNADLNPRVKVMSVSAPTAALFTPPLPPSSPIAVVTEVTVREVTVEEAEAVMLRLAPERLKKKPGPKPVTMEVG